MSIIGSLSKRNLKNKENKKPKLLNIIKIKVDVILFRKNLRS